MPGWLVYKLTYQALSEIHLGDFSLGFIQKTRYFIPGWTLWGAMTACLVRSINERAEPETYQVMGDFVRENVRTSYAYIVDEAGCLLYPSLVGNTEKFGSITRDQFERQYINSYGKNAINPMSVSSAEGALHEIEVIMKRNLLTKQTVHWQFYIYFRNPFNQECSISIDNILDRIATLQVGAEKNCGMGLLHLETCEQLPNFQTGEDPHPIDFDVENRILRAHYIKEGVSGLYEYIPLRWWRNASEGAAGPGQEKKVWKLYKPGGVLQQNKSPILRYYGIWE